MQGVAAQEVIAARRVGFEGAHVDIDGRAGDRVAIGIEEEAAPEIATLAWKTYWISLGALSKLIDILKTEGVSELVMAGQVKHVQIFSSIRPEGAWVKGTQSSATAQTMREKADQLMSAAGRFQL